MKTKKSVLAVILLFLSGIGINVYSSLGDKSNDVRKSLRYNTVKKKKTFICTGRGGKELPEKVLLMQKCIIEGPLFLIDPVKFDSVTNLINIHSEEFADTLEHKTDTTKIKMKLVLGNNCRCVDPPKEYYGKMGCDLTWETFCVR